MATVFLPPAARYVSAVLEAASYQCFAVGGCVRDSLLGTMPHDWDFATNASVSEMKAVFTEAGIRVVSTGAQHGTLTAVVGGIPYEVTTFRVDGVYRDGRHPDRVTFVDSIEADLSRRDFTINAMAWSDQTGLVDPYGGVRDLNNHLIRCVGSPTERFSEDGLRVLRAIRLAATLGFFVEENTASALLESCSMLISISAERKFSEVKKSLLAGDGDHLAQMLTCFAPALSVAIPGIAQTMSSTVPLMPFVPPSLALRFAAFLSLGDAMAILESLHAPRRLIREVVALLDLAALSVDPELRSVRRFLAAAHNARRFRDALALKRARALAIHRSVEQLDRALSMGERELAQGMALSIKDLAISGDDLLKLGFRPGRALGECLKSLFSQVVELKVPNEPAALLRAAQVFLS